MAAVPKSLAETGRPGSSGSRKGPLSHGRGGAGNIGNSKTDFDPVDLETPTLKSHIYTTGRGGSGNMAKNLDPEEVRKAQDVTAYPRTESYTSSHVGRGGAANVFIPSKEDIENSRKNNESAISDEEPRKKTKSVKGLADRGKELLFGKK